MVKVYLDKDSETLMGLEEERLTSFLAAIVSVEELLECEAFTVGFFERADGNGQSLQLQVTLEDDPSQGYLNYYCLVNDKQATFYGGVISCKLMQGKVEFLLTGDACQELEITDGYIIDFDLGTDELFSLRVGLQRLLDRGPSRLLVSLG